MCPNADLYLINFVGFSEAEELNRVITYSKDDYDYGEDEEDEDYEFEAEDETDAGEDAEE